jgi:hypothetical protein
LAVLAATAACQPGGDQAVPVESAPRFDYQTAKIWLPLDQYAMAPEESNLLNAARIIEMRACVIEAGVDPAWLPPDDRIAEILTSPPYAMPDWRYGVWNAEYVSEYGIEGPSVEEPLSWLPDSPEFAAASKDPKSLYNRAMDDCGGDHATQFVGRGAVGAKFEPWASANIELYFEAAADKRWAAAMKTWEECVEASGYRQNPDADGPQPEIPAGASAEAQAKAWVEAARCSDEVGTARTLANIEAEYQVEFIGEHEAELLEIKQLVRAMAAEAEETVRAAGFTWRAPAQ